MCATPQGILSALVLRAKAGKEVTREELAALLKLKCTVEQMSHAFRGDEPELVRARALLATLG